MYEPITDLFCKINVIFLKKQLFEVGNIAESKNRLHKGMKMEVTK